MESSYLICTTPSAGEETLCEALAGTNCAGRPAAYFDLHREGRKFWRDLGIDATTAYLEQVVVKTRSANGVFGAALHWVQMPILGRECARESGASEPPPALLEQKLPGLRFLWWRRRDKIAQGISYYLTLESNALRNSGSAAPPSRASERPPFDHAKIAAYVAATEALDERWAAYFQRHGLAPLQIDQEDFLASPARIFASVVRYLDLPGVSLPFSFRPAPAPTALLVAEWAKRFTRQLVAVQFPSAQPAPSRQESAMTPQSPAPEADAGQRDIETWLNYAAPGATKPVRYNPWPPPEAVFPRPTGNEDPRLMPIRDARPIAAELSLDRQGFVLQPHKSRVSDFYDKGAVVNTYLPEIERLLKTLTGADKVTVFEWTIRCSPLAVPGSGIMRPSMHVHNDCTDISGPRRVRDFLLPQEAEAWLTERFAVINVWRPIKGPIRSAPLALCDAASVGPNDLVPTDLEYPERRDEIASFKFNPHHRWYYFPQMSRDEALIFKCFDSARDGRARFTPHTAFENPIAGTHAPARESIEVRSLALFTSTSAIDRR